MARTSLPPGFRFHPTDVELIMYYLKRKVMGKKLHAEAIAEINIYNFSPWDLPDKSCLRSKDLEWFFFCPRERRYASGARVKRATENGFWKTTGKDRPILHNDTTVGMVKTLVFHLGHAPQGERTDWVIHEYRILDDKLAAAGLQDTYVLCKVFKKNGLGPKNGAQYGAPFNEEDWADDDADADENHATSLSPLFLQKQGCASSLDPGSTPAMSSILEGPDKTETSNLTALFHSGSTSGLSLIDKGLAPSSAPTDSEVLVHEPDDEIVRLLASFTDDSQFLFNENGNQKDDVNVETKNTPMPGSDGCNGYSGLQDLDYCALMDEGRLDFREMHKDDNSFNNMVLQDTAGYIELNDLQVPLNWPHDVIGSGQLCDIFGPYSHENMQTFCSAGGYAGMNQASCASSLNVLPDCSDKQDSRLDVREMVNGQFDQGSNVAYNMELAYRQEGNGIGHHLDQHMDGCGGYHT